VIATQLLITDCGCAVQTRQRARKDSMSLRRRKERMAN